MKNTTKKIIGIRTVNHTTQRLLDFDCVNGCRWLLLYLARAACMPCGLYVLLELISFFLNDPLRKAISGSTEPIFTKFSPYGKYLLADYQSDRYFSGSSRDVAMATYFRVKMGKIGRLTFIRWRGIPKRIGISQFRFQKIHLNCVKNGQTSVQ